MSTAPPAARAKIETPPAWKWLMRVTGTFAMLLFLTPTFYVVKYYAVDKPREEAVARAGGDNVDDGRPASAADLMPYWEHEAHTNADPGNRAGAVLRLGAALRQPNMNWRRPLECLSAKATLADVAAHDPNDLTRFVASEELGKVAQGGAVIRR